MASPGTGPSRLARSSPIHAFGPSPFRAVDGTRPSHHRFGVRRTDPMVRADRGRPSMGTKRRYQTGVGLSRSHDHDVSDGLGSEEEEGLVLDGC